ncbi:hypothetical protein RHSIM_Rhsim12G0044800 [Rhododendron simsii]|uniref:Jacalin-type lectin domain-containing protein n=1 Tax=Rhododendron simsii TaxID=118357 RepID=A0A834L9H7_RHOSS|nr:hypothetical protein RHSIM_Rhsim12G0044800 [Rhododendron simsii]
MVCKLRRVVEALILFKFAKNEAAQKSVLSVGFCGHRGDDLSGANVIMFRCRRKSHARFEVCGPIKPKQSVKFHSELCAIRAAEKPINTYKLHKTPASNPSIRAMISGAQGWISLGPWGGKGGEYSAYKAEGPIMQITIRHGDVIDSILFESQSYNGNVIGSSVKIGGTGGSLSSKGNVGNEGGCISLGLEGGKEGAYWAYKADEPIMVISIRYGEAIDSILFQSRTGNKLGRTMKIGDNGGGTTKTVGHSIAHSWIRTGIYLDSVR